MLRFSNIRIGAKLAIMSGISILLVIGMVAASMRSNALTQEFEYACDEAAGDCT